MKLKKVYSLNLDQITNLIGLSDSDLRVKFPKSTDISIRIALSQRHQQLSFGGVDRFTNWVMNAQHGDFLRNKNIF